MENKNLEIGVLVLRVFLGFSFALHGLVKFQGGITNTVGWFESIGIPGFMGYFIAIAELIGGVLLIAGLGTRYIAALFAIIMIGAIIKVKLSAGFIGGYELDIAFAAMAIFLILNPQSNFALDAKLFAKNKEENTNKAS